MAAILIVPGLDDSGPEHWQTWLEGRESGARRVTQEQWSQPDLERWAARIRETIDQIQGSVWLVAHSFGCLASVQAAAACPTRVAGTLLVAPADPERLRVGRTLHSDLLAFPSMMVVSTTDPWLSVATGMDWAQRWGSRVVNLGPAGHINVDSGYGPWPGGQALLHQFQQMAGHCARRPWAAPETALENEVPRNRRGALSSEH